MGIQNKQLPEQAGQINFPKMFAGDTMGTITFSLSRMSDSTPVIPTSAKAAMRGRSHKDKHTLPVSIDGSGNVTVGGTTADITIHFKEQVYDYDVVFVMDNGKETTYVRGTISVVDRVTA